MDKAYTHCLLLLILLYTLDFSIHFREFTLNTKDIIVNISFISSNILYGIVFFH